MRVQFFFVYTIRLRQLSNFLSIKCNYKAVHFNVVRNNSTFYGISLKQKKKKTLRNSNKYLNCPVFYVPKTWPFTDV